jgi:hypothetical protein
MTPKRKTTRTCNHGRARQWDPRVACTRLPSKSCKILRVLCTPLYTCNHRHVIALISGIYNRAHARACCQTKSIPNQGMRSWELIGRCGVHIAVLLFVSKDHLWELGSDINWDETLSQMIRAGFD